MKLTPHKVYVRCRLCGCNLSFHPCEPSELSVCNCGLFVAYSVQKHQCVKPGEHNEQKGNAE